MTSPTLHTLVAHVEDRPGVLNRAISLFRRRGFNIESLTVARTERPDISRITLVVRADVDEARRLETNLYKLVNVLHVEDLTTAPAVVRELALFKVRADAQARPRVLELCEALRPHVLDATPDSLLVEVTGGLEEINQLAEALRPHGVIELVRTGVVAMARGATPSQALFTEPAAGTAA
jgi:acetolactate synthase-1/3 small subunit